MRDIPIHLIAEAGTNHNGRVATGKTLIDAGRAAGADSVKFQAIFPEGLYLPRLYRNGTYQESEVYQRRAKTALDEDAFRALAAHCRERGVGFSASVFDMHGIRLLDELDVNYIKTASCDLNNSRLLRAVAETGRRMVISTGMATLEEIEQAVKDVTSTGNGNIVLMHCLSVYPCPPEMMNLGFIDRLRKAFGFAVGLSDHTESSVAAAIAVSKGVTWIEKHITMDRGAEGFDHAYAMEPAGFAAYARDVAAAWYACRVPAGKVGTQEAAVRQRARRGLYAARDIATGEHIAEADVLVVRPEGPLPPNAFDQVVGSTAVHDIRQYEAFSWDALAQRGSEKAAQQWQEAGV
jgi:N,N'-diacetyllegionaminate synthase